MAEIKQVPFVIKEGVLLDVELTDNCNIKLTNHDTGQFIFINITNKEFEQMMVKIAAQMVRLGVIKDTKDG